MSDEQAGTGVEPEGQPEAPASPQVYTKAEVDALLSKVTSQVTDKAAQLAFESVQGYTDRREKELQARVESVVEALKATGQEASPELKLQLRNRFAQERDAGNAQGEVQGQPRVTTGKPQGQPQVPSPEQQRWQDNVDWALETWQRAGIDINSLDVDFMPDDPQFEAKVLQVLANNQQASQKQVPPEAFLQTTASASSTTGMTLEQQYKRDLEKQMEKNPYLSGEEKRQIRKRWRDKGAPI